MIKGCIKYAQYDILLNGYIYLPKKKKKIKTNIFKAKKIPPRQNLLNPKSILSNASNKNPRNGHRPQSMTKRTIKNPKTQRIPKIHWAVYDKKHHKNCAQPQKMANIFVYFH